MPDAEASLSRNETLRTIWNRRSVRNFSERPVGDEDLRTVLHAANQAPSAHNQQSWRFCVLRGRAKNDLATLVNERSEAFPKPSAALLRMASLSIASAPVVVAIMNTGELIRRGTDLFKVDKQTAHEFFRIMEVQSSAAGVENMLLAATSLGMGSVWLGILVLLKEDVLRFLGEPDGEFVAIVPLGYPARAGVKPAKRGLDIAVKNLGE